MYGRDHQQGARRRNDQPGNNSFLIADLVQDIHTAGLRGKIQYQRADKVSPVKCEVNQLRLKLCKIKVGLAKRYENTIAGSHEAPEEKNRNQRIKR